MDNTPENNVNPNPNGADSAVGSPTSGVHGPNAPAGEEVDRQSNPSSTEHPAVAMPPRPRMESLGMELLEEMRILRLQPTVPSKTLELVLPILTGVTSMMVPQRSDDQTRIEKSLFDEIHAQSPALAPGAEVPAPVYPIETRSQASISEEMRFATPRGGHPELGTDKRFNN